MANMFNREIARSITHSLGRFLAIAAIVALGTGFYAGLRMTAPDMKIAADDFYDGTALMDIRVVSTLGLTDDDLAALRHVEGVEAVMGAYETDVMATIAGETYATRVHSLPASAQTSDTSDGVHALSDDPDYLNRPILLEGSWPENEGECVLSGDLVLSQNTQIGDTITLTEGLQNVEDTLASRTYTVVGYVSSSYYATSSSLGTTSLGTGTIQEYMYVLESDFSSDLPYSEAYITVRGAADEHASSEAYDKRVTEVMERIEAMAPEREQLRVTELKDDAQAELDESRAEYERERADAQTQLDDAKRQLDDAAATIAESEQQLVDAQAQYDSGVAELATQRSTAQAQLDAAAAQVAEGQAQVDAARPAIEQAQTQLSDAWAQWQQGADALAAAWVNWQTESDQLAAQLTTWQTNMDAWQVKWDANEADPTASDYAATKQALEDQKNQLDAAKVQLDNGQAALNETRLQLVSRQASVDSTQQQLNTQQAAFNEQKAQFDAAVARVEQGASDLAAARSEAEAQLAAAQQQLDSAAAQISQGRSELEQGKADYEQGLTEYNEQSADAQRQLADAKEKLDDAQRQIDDLAAPEWLIMDRSTNYGVSSFEADADRVDSIAQVFPFIFFLVAALVALTTMTRMVEEERVLIGTFKALGYRRTRIASKYLIYAAIASGAGSIIGIGVLSQVLPAVIMTAYSIIYFVPSMPLPLPIDWGLALLAAGLGVGVTLFATWAAAWTTLRERPALLMLPRTPKAGKRILLERIGPLWRRFSFSWKVTLRNLFRYKKRFIMTVIGIAGCTALLLTGLGLSDAINDIINKQYGEITKYNATIALDDDLAAEETSAFAADGDNLAIDDASATSTATDADAADSDDLATDADAAATDASTTATTDAIATDASPSEARQALDALLTDETLVASSTFVQRESMLASGPQDSDVRVDVVVPEDPTNFDEFFTLRTRLEHTPVEFNDENLLLTEKLATELGVGVGDSVTFTVQDAVGNATNTAYEVVVSGVVENYIYHYAFMGPKLYERLTGEEPLYSFVFANVLVEGQDRVQFGDDARAIEGVKTVAYNDETIDAYRDMLSSVNMIVVVLVVAAAALAFIVLYNLTNINITERMREIATLKVLGFTPREMNAYIFRETFLLTAIGCAVGLVLGVWMESFVVVTAEVNQVMFGREIHLMSFVIAFALTMLFSVVVMLAMRGKLAHIDMVESLKSNE